MVREMHRVLDPYPERGPRHPGRLVSLPAVTVFFCSGVDLHSVDSEPPPEARQFPRIWNVRKFMDPLMMRFSELRHPDGWPRSNGCRRRVARK